MSRSSPAADAIPAPGCSRSPRLVGILIHAGDRGVHVQKRGRFRARQQRCVARQTSECLAGHDIELTHSAPGEPSKESAQRRRCPDATEKPRRCPVADHFQVIDRVGADHHTRHDQGDLHPLVRRTATRRSPKPNPPLGSRMHPARSANRNTGTRSVHDTRFGSSNIADTAAAV